MYACGAAPIVGNPHEVFRGACARRWLTRSSLWSQSRHGPIVTDAVRELLATETALGKLRARGISVEEGQQLLNNRHVLVRRGGRPRRSARALRARRLLIGRTDGGRAITLVIERTLDPTIWLVVTGWEATPAERKILTG